MINRFTAMALLAALSACSFNQSAKKDLVTGASSRGDGLGTDEVTIEASGQTGKENRFVYGETVNLVFENVTGFQKEGNKVFPGLSLHITENEKDTVLAYPDLFADLQGGTDLSPLQLQAKFVAALPYRNNENHTVHVRIWDKNGDGTFVYELPFTVAESELLDIEAKGIDYKSIYLWNASKEQPVLDNEIDQNETLNLLLEGIDGLTVENGKAFPALSLELKDREGNVILSNPNLLVAFETTGADPQKIADQLSATITFTKGQVVNPCAFTAILSDQKSDKQVKITTELTIE